MPGPFVTKASPQPISDGQACRTSGAPTGIVPAVPFRNIEDPAKLRRLLEAVFLLEADLSLPVLLRHIVEEACSMAGARYGALGVLNEDRTGLSEFITVGIEPGLERVIGDRPTGKGVLGLLITDPRPLRLADLKDHPESYGFPPSHPPMTSFLGVPVAVRDEVYGNLYLTEKIGWSEFTKDDEELVMALAQAAGIAIDNARLHGRVREIAVFDDRDRIARDLHDAVIQRLFAIGLSLQGITRSITTASISDRLNRAIVDIDETIRQIRSSIFELSSVRDEEGARARVLRLVNELDPVLGFEVHVSFEGPVDSAMAPESQDHLLFVLREALTNVAKHARATTVSVSVSVRDRECALVVMDNGIGIPDSRPEGGLGLSNLEKRANKLGGRLLINSSAQGTQVNWTVPAGETSQSPRA